MDREKMERLAALLGEPVEKIEAALEALGGEEHFYYNPSLFRRLHSIDCSGLKKLVVPNLKKLRMGL